MGAFSAYEYEEELRHMDRVYAVHSILNVFFNSDSFSVTQIVENLRKKRNVGRG